MPLKSRTPNEGDTRVRVDDDHVLVLCGVPLQSSDQRVLEAFAVQTSLVLEHRRLRERENHAAFLAVEGISILLRWALR